MGVIWHGFLNPFYDQCKPCPSCKNGYSAAASLYSDQWYGNAPFDPVEYGAKPISMDDEAFKEAIRKKVEWSIELAKREGHDEWYTNGGRKAQHMKLREKMLARVRAKKQSDETFKTYWHWCEKFMLFVRHQSGQWRHPKDCGRAEVEAWLSSLANGAEWCSANTQNVALQSVCYLYREVLRQPLEGVNALRAKSPQRVRDVLDVSEVAALLAELRGVELLATKLMYAAGLRIGDVVNLRIKDLSFERKQIHVRSGKGAKDRHCQFPEVLHDAVRRQVGSMRVLWKHDRAEGLNGVSLPKAWSRKSASSHLDFSWWYLFASDNYSRCPKSGRMLRHHRDMGHVARLIKEGCQRAGITKRITSHCLRHSFATHSLENGVPIHTLQKLMGHNDIRTTETYLHVAKDGPTSARSPLESLLANPQPLIDRKAQQTDQANRAQPFQLRVFAG